MENIKKWYSYDLDGTTAKHHKTFLKKVNIKYEASEDYALIHFEIYADVFQDNCIKSFLAGFACADSEFNAIPF
jgi:hypothetical protein